MPLTETSIKRPVATLMTFLVIITLGIAGLRHLPIDLLPPLEFPQLTVHVEYPNVGPEEIEQTITDPVENALAGVTGRGADALQFAIGVQRGHPRFRPRHQS